MTGTLRVIPLRLNILLKVLLVTVEVLCAGERIVQKDQQGQEHLRCHLSVDSLELIQIDTMFGPEHFLKKILNLLLILKPIEEDLTDSKQTFVKVNGA